MTTYNIGVGQTYTTFTAANAALTFVGDDVIDGGGGAFAEKWTTTEGGTSGHPIIIKDAVINGPTDYALVPTKGYTTFENITASAPTRNIYASAATSGLIFNNVTSLAGAIGIQLSSASNSEFNDCAITNAAGSYGLYLLGTTDDVKIRDMIITSSGTTYSARIDGVTNIDIDGLRAVSPLGWGFYFSNVTGVVKNAAVDSCNNRSVYITGCTGANDLLFDSVLITNSTAATAPGIEVINNTGLTTGTLTLKNSTIKDGAYSGIAVKSSKNIILENVTSSGNAAMAFDFNTGCNGVSVNDCLAYDNDGDAFFGNDTAANVSFLRCKAFENGTDSDTGDAFTFHLTCSGISIAFCVAAKNRNTAVANVGTCSGSVYNNTFYNNHVSGFHRGSIWHAVTSGYGWTYKNNIIVNTTIGDDWAGILVMIENGATTPTMDYNCYWSTNPTPFWVRNGGVTGTTADYDKYDFAGWKTYSSQDTHSIFADPKMANPEAGDYRVLPTSPCVNAGAWVAGINDNGVYDIWTRKVYGVPNIGADQGAGMPISMSRSSGFSKHFR